MPEKSGAKVKGMELRHGLPPTTWETGTQVFDPLMPQRVPNNKKLDQTQRNQDLKQALWHVMQLSQKPHHHNTRPKSVRFFVRTT